MIWIWPAVRQGTTVDMYVGALWQWYVCMYVHVAHSSLVLQNTLLSMLVPRFSVSCVCLVCMYVCVCVSTHIPL